MEKNSQKTDLERVEAQQAYADKIESCVSERLDRFNLMLKGGDNCSNSKNFHLLIVEDDLMDVDTIRTILKAKGIDFSIKAVNTAEEAIMYLKREKPYSEMPVPDMVVVDYDLPNMKGDKVIEYLKSNSFTKWIPSIMLTGVLLPEDVKHHFEFEEKAEKSLLIHKPVKPKQFINAFAALNKFWFLFDTPKTR